ncbi:class I SAM-dependent methyltransferase [Lentzea albidocapillata]|uniref:Methyltransferase domain-containing protein n=1 Tax=Lentzea albidocapillata TaxID=40571 RepID=A0A1W2DVW6_9PSEU|nr:class I SAM-dependent methyltransferase [Lentzea albidocapillata]SMD01166.1 Methyltransferase domain-containing protein [Lentzea albidocapillata]
MSSPQAIWERYAAKYAPRRAVNAAGATTWLNWTQYPDHGPDETVLGDLRGRRVLELGSGAGANLAHLAALGAVCTGIDIAPSRAELARQTWGHLGGLEFATADAVDYLAGTNTSFDIVYSIFGAVWFIDPEVLFPLVRRRMSDGGVFAFSQPPAAPQENKADQVVQQRHLPVRQWTEQLAAASFSEIKAETVDAPEPGKTGTVLIYARAA